MKNKQTITVVDYISAFPKEVAKRLREIRSVVKKCAPGATETIAYGMPGYKLHGVLLYCAACKNHIGLYAMPSTQTRFKKELAKYKTSKGTVQFQHDEPLPLTLIAKIVKFRVRENMDRANN